MTPFSSDTSLLREEFATKEVTELRKAIQENILKLKEVQQERLIVEEETINSTRETERRMELVMERGEVVDALQQLGRRLQEKKHLSEQLNRQAPLDGNQRAILLERRENASKKAKGLVAEILEVKRHLRDIKARNMTAQALISVPASKSKRNRGKQ